MNRARFGSVLLMCWLAHVSLAAGQPARTAGEPDAAGGISGASVPSRAAAAAPGDNSEVFSNIVIAPGKSHAIDSTLDYSSAATVAVTVQCIVCGTLASSLTTAGLVLQARWMVPHGGAFVATENKSAGAFLYWDSGGAIFNVFGALFRLNLQNNGTQTIFLQQVTLLRRGQ